MVLLDKVTSLPASSGQKGIILLVSFLESQGVLNNEGKPRIDYEYSNRVVEKRRLAIIKSYVAKNREVVFLSDFSEIEDFETLNKLIYRKNMHCFKLSSPVDDARRIPFSVFAKKKKGGSMVRSKSENIRKQLQGRWKKINVSERYLESFVKEML